VPGAGLNLLSRHPTPDTRYTGDDVKHDLCKDSGNLERRFALKKTILQLLALVVLLFATSTGSWGQTVPSSLASLPEADTLIYINSQRIFNEAAPRLLPEKDLAEMRKGFAEAKEHVGVDPSKIDYVVIAVRFRKPTGDLSFMPPEFLAVASGDFSADSLIVLARSTAGDKLRDESYSTKTLGLMTIDPIAKEAEKNPMLKSFSEVGIVTLNPTTIAVGTTAYLKAAVDASEGQGRISTESLNSLLRDPTALVSIAGSPLTSFAKSFGFLGTEGNARPSRCDTKFGDFYAAVTMDATNFMLRGALNADNPDTAKIIHNLVGGLLRQAISSVPDKTAQAVLNNISITPQDHELVVRGDISQQTVINFIKEQMAPKPAASKAVVAQPAAKKPVAPKRRRSTRRP
jgi:hypothetical protein